LKPTELNNMQYGDYSVSPLKEECYNNSVLGFDTETSKKGNAVLIASSDKQYKILKNFKNVVEFLTQHSFRNTFNFFFNLEFDTNALIKYLPKKNLKDMADYNYTVVDPKFNGDGKLIGGVEVSIIPRKLLSISLPHLKKVFRFYDIAQFYQLGSLANTYEKTFKTPYNKIKDASNGFEYKDIDDDVIQYCIEDADVCQKLADNFVKACQRLVPLKRFYSPASLGKAQIRQNLIRPYKFVKSALQQFALYSFNGGRIEVIKRGFFEEAYIYDINSAYPTIQTDLKGIGHSNWTNQEYEKYADHSFFKISINIDDVIVSPLKYRTDSELIVYPQGSLIDIYVSKVELECLMRHNFDFIIKLAHHNSGSIEKPFDYMKEVYKQRLIYKEEDNPLQLPLKLALNSSYGVMIERQKKTFKTEFTKELGNDVNCTTFTEDGVVYIKDYNYKAGQFFNPVYASEITAGIRCKIYDDSIKHEKHIIKFSTDSIAFDKKVKLPFSKKLGDYGDSNKYRGIVVGNGVYMFDDGIKKIKKFRSFNKTLNVLDVIEDNAQSSTWEYTKNSPRKLKESSKNDFNHLNQFMEKSKKLSLNFDHKRRWDWEPRNFKELRDNVIHSKPLII